MESMELYCLICRQLFLSEDELKDHNKSEHTSKISGKFHCITCNKDFRDSFNLKRHASFMHSEKNDLKLSKSTKCPLCANCYQKKDILNHFVMLHEINIDEEDLHFSSLESFDTWKIQMEKSTKSRYVKVRNVYRYKDGSTLNTFYCHRDGFVKNSRSKNIRRMKSFGSNKINGHCPSKIVVKCNSENKVSVRYVKTHVGHATELNRISLDKKEKEELAEKLSMNIPFDQILDDIRDSIRESDLQRVHLLNKQDLRNIARDFKVDKKFLPSQENTNIDIGIDKIYTVVSNFVRLYKQKGMVSSEYPQLRVKDFLLLVINDVQKEVLDKYGNNTICIDITHGLFLHDIDMYTLFVLDDFHTAFPCAFFFSNRSDFIALELFFLSIQDVMKRSIKPNLLITTETIHDAWSAVMTPPPSYIYCPWHVDLEWRTNLKKVQNKEKQTVIYKQLRQLLEEQDINEFSSFLENVLHELGSDNESKDFAQYFEKFKHTTEKWAYCHRSYFGNRFLDLEQLHKSLKYIYLKRKNMNSFDDTICNIMSFLRAKYLENSIITNINRLVEVKNRHKSAVTMAEANLSKINGTTWNVSESNNNEIFHVQQVKPLCNNCQIRCKPCSVCIHLYICSCYDSTIHWNMCQHIHLVCIVANHEHHIEFDPIQKPLKISEDEHSSGCDSSNMSFSEKTSCSESLTIIHDINSPLCCNNEIEMKKKELISKFTFFINNATSIEQLDLIGKQLSPCGEVFGIMSKTKFDLSSH